MKQVDRMRYRFLFWVDKQGEETKEETNIGLVFCLSGLMKGFTTPLHRRIIKKLNIKPGDVFKKTETYEVEKVQIAWTCPNCGKKHVWYWEYSDVVVGKIGMYCSGGCRKTSSFNMSKTGKLTAKKVKA